MAGRILIVEDEGLIALDIEQELEEAGFEIVAVCGTVEDALKKIDTEQIDAVTLDGNLYGQSAAPIAERLISKNIPYLVLTGYSSGQVGDWINEAPRINKPHDSNKLVRAVKGLVNKQNSS